MRIEWTDDLSVCVDTIDKQHQHFIEIVNDLNEAHISGESEKIIGAILSELEAYANYHFATEEKYFAMFQYSGAESHIKEHKKMLRKIGHIKSEYKKGKNVIPQTMVFLDQWFREHLVKVDHKYSTCFIDHGLV